MGATLLSNALKIAEGAEVTHFVDHASNPRAGKHRLSFSVSDTGSGIDPCHV